MPIRRDRTERPRRTSRRGRVRHRVQSRMSQWNAAPLRGGSFLSGRPISRSMRLDRWEILFVARRCLRMARTRAKAVFHAPKVWCSPWTDALRRSTTKDCFSCMTFVLAPSRGQVLWMKGRAGVETRKIAPAAGHVGVRIWKCLAAENRDYQARNVFRPKQYE